MRRAGSFLLSPLRPSLLPPSFGSPRILITERPPPPFFNASRILGKIFFFFSDGFFLASFPEMISASRICSIFLLRGELRSFLTVLSPLPLLEKILLRTTSSPNSAGRFFFFRRKAFSFSFRHLLSSPGAFVILIRLFSPLTEKFFFSCSERKKA